MSEETLPLIQGIAPGSRNEAYVAMALDKLGVEYRFQVPLGGGRSVRGGQVIDFVVYNPTPTPVFVQGEYWHSQRADPESPLKIAQAEHVYHTQAVLLMGEETDTPDKAMRVVKERLL